MKTNGTDSIMSMLQHRLDVERARQAAVGPGEMASEIRQRNEQAGYHFDMKLLAFDRACGCVHGIVEQEEYADVAPYAVGNLGGVVPAPRVRTRAICSRCGGTERVLTPLGEAFLERLLGLGRDVQTEEAITVEAFNVEARKQLAERAKVHEADRQRYLEAEQIEAEAAAKAKALRDGRALPTARKVLSAGDGKAAQK